MNLVKPLLGLILVLAGLGLLFALLWLPRARKIRRVFRWIPAMQKLRRSIGLSVEEGGRIHVSLGKAAIFSPNNASALAGLSTL